MCNIRGYNLVCFTWWSKQILQLNSPGRLLANSISNLHIIGRFVVLPLHLFLWCWISISVKTRWHLSQMYSLGPGIAMATSWQSGQMLLALRSQVIRSEYVPRLILCIHRYCAYIMAKNQEKCASISI